jgi:hypothetical protein
VGQIVGNEIDPFGQNAAFLLTPCATCSPIVTSPATTPLPVALPLFATGLGVIGLFGRRRKVERRWRRNLIWSGYEVDAVFLFKGGGHV